MRYILAMCSSLSRCNRRWARPNSRRVNECPRCWRRLLGWDSEPRQSSERRGALKVERPIVDEHEWGEHVQLNRFCRPEASAPGVRCIFCWNWPVPWRSTRRIEQTSCVDSKRHPKWTTHFLPSRRMLASDFRIVCLIKVERNYHLRDISFMWVLKHHNLQSRWNCNR